MYVIYIYIYIYICISTKTKHLLSMVIEVVSQILVALCIEQKLCVQRQLLKKFFAKRYTKCCRILNKYP